MKVAPPVNVDLRLHPHLSAQPARSTVEMERTVGVIMDSAMGMILEGSETVLVVDDELFIVSVAHDILTRHGYRVLGASSGPEALHLFKSWPDLKIDVALLDIVMPVITGPELALELQKIRPNLPVIFISAYPEIAEQRPQQLRHLQFVSKPFTSVKLLGKIREVLDTPQRREASKQN